MLQLRWKILSDATKTWSSQTNKLIKILEKKKRWGVDNKSWQKCGETGTLACCYWGYKMVLPWWKPVW